LFRRHVSLSRAYQYCREILAIFREKRVSSSASRLRERARKQLGVNARGASVPVHVPSIHLPPRDGGPLLIGVVIWEPDRKKFGVGARWLQLCKTRTTDV
jgi:hypothetical protein